MRVCMWNHFENSCENPSNDLNFTSKNKNKKNPTFQLYSTKHLVTRSQLIVPLLAPQPSIPIPILRLHQADTTLLTCGKITWVCIICTNLSSWTSQDDDPWLKQNQLQTAYKHVMRFEIWLATETCFMLSDQESTMSPTSSVEKSVSHL